MTRREMLLGVASALVARGVSPTPCAEVGSRPLAMPAGAEGQVLAEPAAVVFAPGGAWVGVGGRAAGVVGVWDSATGRLVTSFRAMDQRVDHLALDRDGTRLVAAGPARTVAEQHGLGEAIREEGGLVRVWDVTARRMVAEKSLPDPAGAVAFAFEAPGILILARGALCHWEPMSGRIECWPPPEPADAQRFPASALLGVTFDVRKGRAAAIRLRSNPDVESVTVHDLIIWDLRSGRCRAIEAPGALTASWPIALGPDGRELAVGHHGAKRLTILDPGTGAELDRPARRAALLRYCRRLAFSPDGDRLAVAGLDNGDKARDYVQVIDLATGHQAVSAPGPPGPVRGLVVLADGRVRAVSGGFRDANSSGQLRPLVPVTVWEFTPPGLP